MRSVRPVALMFNASSLGVLLAALAGCQAQSRSAEASDREALFHKHPSATVEAVRIDQQTGDGARVATHVRVANPNDFTLPIDAVSYRVTVDGYEPFAIPDYEPAQSLTPSGDVLLELPAAFATEGVDIAGRAYTVTGRVTYHPPGAWLNALYDTGLPLPTAGFDASGVLGDR